MAFGLGDVPLVGRGISSTVVDGYDPTTVDTHNPITLFIIQLFIIIVFTQGLGWCFKYIHQPKVIAEVVGGILLGPTVFGRIPNFSDKIFPKASLPYLNLVSTIGLVLFLFVVGLEVDISVAKKNGRKSALISLAGMCLPFGLGSAMAVPVYRNFVNDKEKVPFNHFILFICVSFSITAFPVLCRILTATKLLDTNVGVIVLSAGVGNDVVGWVLLALTLALSTNGPPLTALYILLCAVGWSIILLWPIRKGFVWMARRTGSIEHGPTPGMMTLTLLIVFGSAFVTGAIGVHPIFGGFIAGLIIPHEGGFAIAVTERIDDLVTMLFLPIYFVLSGIQTDLGLLNTGFIWGYVILLCVLAFAGKFLGCAGTAKLLGFTWRESGAIGMLMSCKGLVELIVLNVGLEVGIIDQKLFSMMVVVAVVLTFITTPCTLWIYPRKYHTRTLAIEPDSTTEKQNKAARDEFLRTSAGGAAGGREYTSRLLVVLQKLEHLGATMFITQLLEPAPAAAREAWPAITTSANDPAFTADSDTDRTANSSDGSAKTPIRIDALKLIELTGRTFSVMQSAEKDQLLHSDDALQLFKHFGRLRGMDVHPHISIVGQDSFPLAVADYATELDTELVIVPWTIPVPDGSNASSSTQADNVASSSAAIANGILSNDGSPMYTHFIRNLFTQTTTDVAVFVDRGFGSHFAPPGSGQHVFCPFFGGPDDRLALRLVVQLCHHTNVTATVVRVSHADGTDTESEDGTAEGSPDVKLSDSARAHQVALQTNQLTIGGPKLDEQSRVVSETADNIAWTYYTTVRGASSDAALQRVSFSSISTAQPLKEAASYAEAALIAAKNHPMWRPLLIVTGRGRRLAAHNHEREVSSMLAERGQNPTVGAELRKTIGDTATTFILAGGQSGQASFLVCEAGQ